MVVKVHYVVFDEKHLAFFDWLYDWTNQMNKRLQFYSVYICKTLPSSHPLSSVAMTQVCRLTHKLASPWFPLHKAYGIFYLDFLNISNNELCDKRNFKILVCFSQEENLHKHQLHDFIRLDYIATSIKARNKLHCGRMTSTSPPLSVMQHYNYTHFLYIDQYISCKVRVRIVFNWSRSVNTD